LAPRSIELRRPIIGVDHAPPSRGPFQKLIDLARIDKSQFTVRVPIHVQNKTVTELIIDSGDRVRLADHHLPQDTERRVGILDAAVIKDGPVAAIPYPDPAPSIYRR
jgi:hypothetical protein